MGRNLHGSLLLPAAVTRAADAAFSPQRPLDPVILAYRKAAASTIAPFSYVQLLFAGLLGFGVFGTVPGAMTLVGGAVIAASGLYTAHRERIRAREARLAAAGIGRP